MLQVLSYQPWWLLPRKESRLCRPFSSSAQVDRERNGVLTTCLLNRGVLMWRKRNLCGSRSDCLSSRISRGGRGQTTFCSWLVFAGGTVSGVCLVHWACYIIHLHSPFLMSKGRGSLKWKVHFSENEVPQIWDWHLQSLHTVYALTWMTCTSW